MVKSSVESALNPVVWSHGTSKMGIPHSKMLELFVDAHDVTRSWGLQYFPRGRAFAFFFDEHQLWAKVCG
jgi:hypothetical protein